MSPVKVCKVMIHDPRSIASRINDRLLSCQHTSTCAHPLLARSLLLVAIKEQVALHSSYRINLLATHLILVKKSLSTPPAPVERSDW